MKKLKRPQTPKMPHSGHNKHLCYLVNLGFQHLRAGEYKKLVRNSNFVCRKCGRGASDARNLCAPVKL